MKKEIIKKDPSIPDFENLNKKPKKKVKQKKYSHPKFKKVKKIQKRKVKQKRLPNSHLMNLKKELEKARVVEKNLESEEREVIDGENKIKKNIEKEMRIIRLKEEIKKIRKEK